MPSICTKTGDDGTTGLMFNRRVPKTHPQVEAYGNVDELNAALGCAKAHAMSPDLAQRIQEVQKELVVLMGELAVLPEDRERYREKGFHFVEASMTDRIGGWIEELEHSGLRFEGWATPGATKQAAHLDLARVTCRRAERRVAAMGEEWRRLNPELIRYLNRVSDWLWLEARRTETQLRGPSSEIV